MSTAPLLHWTLRNCTKWRMKDDERWWKDEVVYCWFLSSFTIACTPFWFWTNREPNWHSQQHLMRLLATSTGKALHVRRLGKSTRKESYSQLLATSHLISPLKTQDLCNSMQLFHLRELPSRDAVKRSGGREKCGWAGSIEFLATWALKSRMKYLTKSIHILQDLQAIHIMRTLWSALCLKDPKRLKGHLWRENATSSKHV